MTGAIIKKGQTAHVPAIHFLTETQTQPRIARNVEKYLNIWFKISL